MTIKQSKHKTRHLVGGGYKNWKPRKVARKTQKQRVESKLHR